MTDRPDPLHRVQRSLPIAILFGAAVSAIGISFLEWIGLLIARIPSPSAPVWLEYVAIRAVAGACVGAAMYAAGRLPHGWLRSFLFWTLFFLLIQGDVPDFVSDSRGRFLTVWAGASLLSGLIVGTLFHLLYRWVRARQPAGPEPGAGA